MVGVPRRSKSCATCKKRKVAGNGTEKEAENVSPPPSKTEQQGRETALPSPAPYQANPPLPSQIPALQLVRQQLLASFISPSDTTALATLNPHPEASMLHSWYNYLFACSTSPQLSSGALACYTAFLGRRDNDPSLLSLSRRFYAESLSNTQKALQCRETALRDETLAACLSLVTYETLGCPTEGLRGYWWHSQGCLRLVDLRGPGAHRRGSGRVLFEEFRLHGTLGAFRRHRPNFLSSPAWMALSTQNESRSDTQKLLDIFVLGPEVLQKADRLALLPPKEQFPLMLSMIDDLWDIDDRLTKLKKEVETANEHHLRPMQ
ncbi:hypothetical protein PRZ48_009457 [Zasmidium cellare]|uniref:Uncharacterized protein n=1 Tax=Zasmidium cellare TaxID=395010 RepID=A0ABR0EBT2_ZASCE|nr:hypothetical protein PRZ48_009457 [Zasmidium cellare]